MFVPESLKSGAAALKAVALAVAVAVALVVIVVLGPTIGAAQAHSYVYWQPDNAGNLNAGDRVTLMSGGALSTAPDGSSAAASPGLSMYFRVDGTYMDPASSDAAISVEYYDQGYGFFYIDYAARGLTGTCTFRSSLGFLADSCATDTGYLTNNVVYLQNSRSWKRYTFNLSNLSFDKRLNGGTDFAITQLKGGANDIANQGYSLLVRRVEVDRSATPIDRLGTFEGNYAGFGPPAWVWTRLGSTNEAGHGLYQDNATGPATALIDTPGKNTAGRQATSGSIYLDVNDNYIKDGKDASGQSLGSVTVGVEYLDQGSGSFTLFYDNGSGAPGASAGTVALTNTHGWLRKPFYLTDAKLSNGLAGGNDLRIFSSDNQLVVRDVVVARAPGAYRSGAAPSGFTRSQKVVGAHHFPVFDGFRPSLWEASTIKPKGETAGDNYVAGSYPNGGNDPNYVNTSYSFRSIDTNKKDLTDAADAGIDFFLEWYAGNTAGMNNISVVGTKQMVAAAAQLTLAGKRVPKLGLLLDPVMLEAEQKVRTPSSKIDFSDPATQGLIIKMAEDYFSLVPRDLWATVEGRPIIAVYYLNERSVINGSDLATRNAFMQRLSQQFHATHGVYPYLIADRLWDSNQSMSLAVDEYFSWGASACFACTNAASGFGQPSVFEVGPGFNDGVRTKDRANGAYYAGGWDRATAKGNHMVLIDTFNYFVEGSAISQTAEFESGYLNLTRIKAAAFKATDYSTVSSASLTLGAANTISGISNDEGIADGATVADLRGGRRATGSTMFFNVDDTFLHKNTDTPATITFEFWDDEILFFDMFYDGVNGQTGGYDKGLRFTVSSVTAQSNTKTWKRVSATINDFYAGNRLYPGAGVDFFIRSNVPDKLLIRSVVLTIPQRTPSIPVPPPPAGFTRTFVPIGLRNRGA